MIFGAVFFLIFTAFMGFVINQKQVQDIKRNEEQALSIAEAGLNYYKWYLAHNPNDVTNGTTTPGPYVIPYADPESDDIGEFSLAISSSTACGDIIAIDIESTGSTYEDPDRDRTIYARYAKPTVAEYSYVINSNVWAGDDRTIIGPYHSNGIVRMDGTNNSTVSSGQEDWVCDDSIPCDPYSAGTTLDGVYGDGPNYDLWETGVAPVSFAGITVDLANMKTKAQADGRHFDDSGDYGYLIDFNSNDTFNIYRVTGTQSYQGYTTEDGWEYERHVITNTSEVAGSPFSIPSECSLIFVEDKVWLRGEVSTKVTLAAADVDTIGVDPQIIIDGNITYTGANAGLLAIAEEDVLVGVDVPNDMEINGIFIAQNGRFGRNHYDLSLPASLDAYRYRNSLTINGTIVSNGRVGTKWTSGGSWSSGFNTRYNSYDRDMVTDPPPLTPEVSDTYQFIEWREED
ncbi:MAG: hypothetical protein R3B69_01090 [Candidatus Paceibacterota bacterium]